MLCAGYSEYDVLVHWADIEYDESPRYCHEELVIVQADAADHVRVSAQETTHGDGHTDELFFCPTSSTTTAARRRRRARSAMAAVRTSCRRASRSSERKACDRIAAGR